MTGSKNHQSDEFMMYSFKVNPCPRLDHHNWKHCPHRHPGEVAAQRRHPSLHKPAFCMNLKLYGSCAAGDDCPFSHNTFEMSLHPERYKTTLCTLGDKCNREICFFAHSTEELRTPDVTAPLGAMGQETTITLSHLADSAAAGAGPGADPTAAAAAQGGRSDLPGAEGMVMQQQARPVELQHLLRQVEQQLQLEGPAAQQHQQQQQQQQQQLQVQLQQARMQAAQQQQQLLQQDQKALLLAQAQQQQQQQQMNELVLAQRQLMLANAAGSISSAQAVGAAGMAGQGLLNTSFTGGNSLQPRGLQQQLVPVLLDPAAHRGESFTSQCSTSSYVSGIGALRAAHGTLPVSPLIDRSAHSFTITDRSNTGSFSTLGSVPERPHSFSVGERPQPAALLAGLADRAPSYTLGERPPSFTLLDASRPNSFTIGQHSAPAGGFLVERSAASFSGMDASAGGLGVVEGGLSVVERSAQTQRSFTLGQRPQLMGNMAWYEADPAAGVLQSPGSAAMMEGGAVYTLVGGQQQQMQEQGQQGAGKSGLGGLFQWR